MLNIIFLVFMGLSNSDLSLHMKDDFHSSQVNHVRLTCHESRKVVYQDKQVLIESFPHQILKNTTKGIALGRSPYPLQYNFFRIRMKGIESINVIDKEMSSVPFYPYLMVTGKEMYIYVGSFYEPSETFFDICTKQTMLRVSLSGKMVDE